MTEDMLVDEIKKGLIAKGQRDPSWRLVYGREVLTAGDVVSRIDTDKDFRAWVVKHYLRIATELAGREYEHE